MLGRYGVNERNEEGQMVKHFAKRMEMAVVTMYKKKLGDDGSNKKSQNDMNRALNHERDQLHSLLFVVLLRKT